MQKSRGNPSRPRPVERWQHSVSIDEVLKNDRQEYEKELKRAQIAEECGSALQVTASELQKGSAHQARNEKSSRKSPKAKSSKGKQRALEPSDENLPEVDARQFARTLEEQVKQSLLLPRPPALTIDHVAETTKRGSPTEARLYRQLEEEQQARVKLKAEVKRQDEFIQGLENECAHLEEQQEESNEAGNFDQVCIWKRRYKEQRELLAMAKQQRAELKCQLRDLEGKIEDLETEIGELKKAKKDKEEKLRSTRRRLRRRDEEIDDLTRQLAHRRQQGPIDPRPHQPNPNPQASSATATQPIVILFESRPRAPEERRQTTPVDAGKRSKRRGNDLRMKTLQFLTTQRRVGNM
jgi:chromosome segregation ATPase